MLKMFIQTRKESWISILKIAWPLIVANSFWNLQLTIDRIYLGEYSTESLGAAMTVMGVFWTPMALLQQTASYITTFVAQYYGAKDLKMIGPATWQAIYLSIIGGLLFVGFIFISDDLFNLVGHADNIKILEKEYFDALCFSAMPAALVAVFSGFHTGLGNTKTVIWINAVGLVFNVIFDYVLIFGNFGFSAYGIAGAGYATALANVMAAIAGLILVLKSKNIKDYQLWQGRHFNFDLTKRFLKFGLPSGMQWALEGLAFTIFLIVIGRFSNGEASLVASSIATTVMMLSILPSMGVAQAGMVLVGQHLGDKKPELAEKAVWSAAQVTAFYMAFMSITFLLIPEFYLSWFKNEENIKLWSEVKTIVPYLLMFIALFTTFDSINLNFSFALKGAGDTKFVSLVALTLPWPIMVLPTFLIKEWNGAIYWAWGFATLYGMSIAFIFWRRFIGGKWKSMSVIN